MVDLGADALLVAPPPPPATPEQIIAHYREVAIATQVPIVVLDYPPVSGNLPVSLLKELSDTVEQVFAIKLEELPTAPKIRQLRATIGKRLRIFGGLGGSYCLPELEAGSDGLITGYAYPEHLIGILQQFAAANPAAAAREYERWQPLLAYEAQFGIALRKELLKFRGVITCAAVRSPAAPLNAQTQTELMQILGQADLLP